MNRFDQVQQYFKALSDDSEAVEDVTEYLEEKSAILEDVLFYYTEKLNIFSKDSEKWRHEKGIESSDSEDTPIMSEMNSEQHASLTNFIDDEDLLIELYKDLLQEEYKPPSDNLTALHIHLIGLWLFYSAIKPPEVQFSTLLKLDISALKLVKVAMYAAATFPSALHDIKQKTGARKGNDDQWERSANDILEAFTDLGAQWVDDDNPKKPILIDGKRFSLDWVATRHMIREQGIDLGTKQIRKHLVALKKSGTI